jgi:hypothetical protein
MPNLHTSAQGFDTYVKATMTMLLKFEMEIVPENNILKKLPIESLLHRFPALIFLLR